MGFNSIRDKFLYITDGGHYENTAAYELIRRRLRRVGLHVLGNAWEQIDVRGERMIVIGSDRMMAAVARARRPGSGGTATVDPAADQALTLARDQLDQAAADSRAAPSHVPLRAVRPDARLLDEQRKLITHAIRMAACNTETILARALNGRYARAGDEAYALIREALHASGDITIHGSVLHIRLDPLSAPRRTRALAALCEQLSTTATRYPGTHLVLRYEVKEHPGTA